MIKNGRHNMIFLAAGRQMKVSEQYSPGIPYFQRIELDDGWPETGWKQQFRKPLRDSL